MVENISSINRFKKTGQTVTTIPKAIAGAMKFKHKDKIEWIFDRGDLIVRKV